MLKQKGSGFKSIGEIGKQRDSHALTGERGNEEDERKQRTANPNPNPNLDESFVSRERLQQIQDCDCFWIRPQEA
jgi:hypothetical protein